MLADLLTCKAHHVELILIFIEIEHVTNIDRSRINGRIKLEGRIEGNIGIRDLKLQVEDEIIEGATAEERLAAVNGILESSDLLADKLVDFCNLWLECLHEILINRTFCHIWQTANYLLVCHNILFFTIHLLLVQGNGHLGICHIQCIIGRVETHHRLTFHIQDRLIAAGMVMSEEYHVEAWHLLCYPQGGILLIFGSDNTAILTAVEDTNDNVRLLLLLDDLHPFTGTGHHILKLHSAPEILCQPVRNSWGQHTENGYLHTLTVQDDIRLHIRLTGLGINDVGTQHRAV